ncbi:sister chromatid cohesion 1 protein 3-like [Capsicum annuum]
MGIRKVFLPTNSTHALCHSIILPTTFELDSLDIENELDLNRFEDPHVKSREEITLEEDSFTYIGTTILIKSSFLQDRENNLSESGEASGFGARYMEIDSDSSNTDDHPPQDTLEIETIRDAVHDHGSEHDPLWTGQWNDVMGPDRGLEELIPKEKEPTSLVVEEMVERDEPPTATSAEAQELITNPQISFGYQSPDLVLRSTPPPELPRARRRRRKLLIDDTIALLTVETGRLLDDASALKRRRKIAPSTSLEIWKLNKRSKKDGMLFQPLITGLCDDLCNIYKKNFISAKIKMASSSEEEDHAEPGGTPPGNDLGTAIESLCDTPPMEMPSPSRSGDFTPLTWYNEGLDVENTILPDIPEFDSPAGDLSFLEQDDRTPIVEHGGTPDFGALPRRTRSVVQFLQGKLPVTPISEDTGDLSLNTILEGKTKKICARMFYEALVLKNCGLVNLNQNEPYGDVTLKVTSRLNEQFST